MNKESIGLRIRDEQRLAAVARELGAETVKGISLEERSLLRKAPDVEAGLVRDIAHAISRGEDPLGDAFCFLRDVDARRPLGATYTPSVIVDSMMKWARHTNPERVVDTGSGSGRFLLAASRAFEGAEVVGVEVDPLAALLARANVASSRLSSRVEVRLTDYRELRLEPGRRTLFVGNPPYVRHHLLGAKWKEWLSKKSQGFGLKASQLAGLHVHFFLATALLAKPGDAGVLITAAEWLDVNYGRLLRELLMQQLGLTGLHVLEPTATPFADAMTTAAITCFEIGTKPKTVGLRRVERVNELGDLSEGRHMRRERLENAVRWSPLTRSTKKGPDGFIELGELCRVHRGQVTGANAIWLMPADASGALPESVLFPTVTRAKELFAAGHTLKSDKQLKRCVDIPVDLDALPTDERRLVDAFLKVARRQGADKGFVASHRKAWWSVGLRTPAPILATYMARRSPTFVMNAADARHINVAHGLYPRERMSDAVLRGLAKFLSSSVSTDDGRTYAGGLTKFEPKEMERLLVPGPALLAVAA